MEMIGARGIERTRGRRIGAGEEEESVLSGENERATRWEGEGGGGGSCRGGVRHRPLQIAILL